MFYEVDSLAVDKDIVEISLVISYSHGTSSQQDIDPEVLLIKHCIALNISVKIISDITLITQVLLDDANRIMIPRGNSKFCGMKITNFSHL